MFPVARMLHGQGLGELLPYYCLVLCSKEAFLLCISWAAALIAFFFDPLLTYSLFLLFRAPTHPSYGGNGWAATPSHYCDDTAVVGLSGRLQLAISR